MRKIVISALIAGAAVVATPASAQSWHNQRPAAAQSQIRGEINQLTNQISRAEQRRVISRREAQSLRRQMIQVQRNLAQFSRGGLDRREVTALNRQLDQVRRSLRVERGDSNRRRG